MTDQYILGDGLEIAPSVMARSRHGADFEATMSMLRDNCEMDRARGAMHRLGFGAVCGMPDEILFRELARRICLGDLKFVTPDYRTYIGFYEPPPDPKPKTVPPEEEAKNPFLETEKRDRMIVRAWGLEIGGGILAHNLFEDRIGKIRTTPDPFADPDKDRARRQNIEKRARVGAELEGRSIVRRYQRDVIAELTKIRRAQTGVAVFRAVDRALTKVSIRIDPWTRPVVNASAGPAKVFEKEKRDPLDSFPEEIEHNRRRPWPALVRYTPATWKRVEQEIWADLGIVVNEDEGPGSEPEEVLLHELFHALRYAMGITTRRNPVFQKKRYENSDGRGGLEEFYAILVANIYRSEIGREIRYGHRNFDKSWESVKKFLNTGLNRIHIRMLRRRMPVLFNELKDIDVPWNPLKEFKDAPE